VSSDVGGVSYVASGCNSVDIVVLAGNKPYVANIVPVQPLHENNNHTERWNEMPEGSVPRRWSRAHNSLLP